MRRDSSSSVQVADASVVLAKQLYLARLVGVRDAIIDGPLGLCPPAATGMVSSEFTPDQAAAMTTAIAPTTTSVTAHIKSKLIQFFRSAARPTRR